jgi:hydroxymethylpyrimidine pyrophosphatase-like HAD family hydrolase
MTFQALACDYDGTLTSDDRIGEQTLAALERARGAGLRLILVTGRSFFELIRVCERLDLFDAVVAENGGVLYFPTTGMMRDQAPSPPPRLLAELDRRGVPFQVGRVIVGTWRAEEPQVREALAALGVGMEIVYNRAALMLLPPGVSKGAGVEQAIRALGLSFHDVLALGDAENDLDFFTACGWTACPANAVPELKDRADWIFPGDNGASIAAAITGPILGGLLPVTRSPRHQVALGWSAETAQEVTIAERGINVLIQGDPLSGKSWLAGVLIERLLGRRYALCVIDPEGDYQVLAPLPGMTWTEVVDREDCESALARFDHDSQACVVLDLSTVPQARKVAIIERGLELLQERRQRRGIPHWIILDEAHYSLHREGVADRAIGIQGKGFCLVTYRASALRASVTQAIDVFLFARTTANKELDFLRSVLDRLPTSRTASVVSTLPHLPQGGFLLVRPDVVDASVQTFVAAPRMTSHVRHLRKYTEGQLPDERRFFFRTPDGRLAATAESLGGFLHAVSRVGEDVLRFHATRGDFSRWLLDVLTDRELGRQLAKIERRWARDEIRDLRHAIEPLIVAAMRRAEGVDEKIRDGR